MKSEMKEKEKRKIKIKISFVRELTTANQESGFNLLIYEKKYKYSQFFSFLYFLLFFF